MSYTYYGTLSGANQYFAQRLHSDAWNESNPDQRPMALQEATRIIDNLNYKGVKHSVFSVMYEWDNDSGWYSLLEGDDAPTQTEINSADSSQELEFPRGADSEVPDTIVWACYEIALALLDGFDPDDAVEEADIVRQSYASVSTTYGSGGAAAEYRVYGIPTARVWYWLKPRLADTRIIQLRRAD